MLDYCSTKKISTFVLALIGFSILVFFIEEYTEESEMASETEMRRDFYVEEHEHKGDRSSKVPLATEYPPEQCWKHEEIEFLSKCKPCKEFEINALKADHCLKTGFYDRLNCTKSNIVILRSCTSPKESEQRHFYFFTFVNFVLLVGSYFAATQRKTFLDQSMYTRLPQNF